MRKVFKELVPPILAGNQLCDLEASSVACPYFTRGNKPETTSDLLYVCGPVTVGYCEGTWGLWRTAYCSRHFAGMIFYLISISSLATEFRFPSSASPLHPPPRPSKWRLCKVKSLAKGHSARI